MCNDILKATPNDITAREAMRDVELLSAVNPDFDSEHDRKCCTSRDHSVVRVPEPVTHSADVWPGPAWHELVRRSPSRTAASHTRSIQRSPPSRCPHRRRPSYPSGCAALTRIGLRIVLVKSGPHRLENVQTYPAQFHRIWLLRCDALLVYGPHVHFVFKADNRWAGEVPDQPV